MAEREEQPEVQNALRTLSAEALLTVKTDGWDDDDVAIADWAEVEGATRMTLEVNW